jgi:N-acetylmuramoyl-L-alanine amidase
MLFRVQRAFLSAIFLFVVAAGILTAQQPAPTAPPGQPTPQPTQQTQPPATGQQAPAPAPAPALNPSAPAQSAPAPQPPSPAHFGPVIVLDPAHGGTDQGARGAGTLVEKEITLSYARVARTELERMGYRVILTRNDDSNPSYDDRAATANAHRDTIFITIHVASTGAFGTARTYYNQFAEPLPLALPTSGPATNVLSWEDAQRPYLDVSHRFADILQAEMAQRFAGSPSAATAVAVRELRSIAAPAVAVEISSVVTADPETLTQRAGPLAAAIARSVQLYRPSGSAGTGAQ